MLRAHGSRLVRLLLLAATAAATIATSAPEEPSWGLDAETAEVHRTLAPDETVAWTVSFDSSHPVHLTTVLDDLPLAGVLHVGQEDSRPGCAIAPVTYEGKAGEWREVGRPGGGVTPRLLVISTRCADGEPTEIGRGTRRITIRNDGDAAIELDARTKATIGGAGTDVVPEGAFVRIEDAR
jgi:hypothetical protein